MSAVTHAHDQFHRGLVPATQLPVPTTEEFTASGGAPETFTLSDTPLGFRRVYRQGLRVAAAGVSGTGVSVTLDTTTNDHIVVDYEIAP